MHQPEIIEAKRNEFHRRCSVLRESCYNNGGILEVDETASEPLQDLPTPHYGARAVPSLVSLPCPLLPSFLGSQTPLIHESLPSLVKAAIPPPQTRNNLNGFYRDSTVCCELDRVLEDVEERGFDRCARV